MPSSRLKKALAQHHLRHGALLAPLLEFLQPEGERVVEIGPGGGVLIGRLPASKRLGVLGKASSTRSVRRSSGAEALYGKDREVSEFWVELYI